MVYLQGITAHLVTNHTALSEFKPPRSEIDGDEEEPNTVTRYVELMPSTTFSIFVHVRLNLFRPLCDAIVLRVFMDGALAMEIIQRVPGSTEGGGEHHVAPFGGDNLVEGYINGSSGEPLRFPRLVAHESESEESDNAEIWDEREVVLQISHGRLKDPSADGSYGAIADLIDLIGAADTVHAITFKYRPHSILTSIFGVAEPRSRRLVPEEQSADEDGRQSKHPADQDWKENLVRNRSKDLFCYCRRIQTYDCVVTCDNDKCKVQTFHWKCVNLAEEPQFEWFCPDCRLLPKGDLVVNGETWFWGRWKNPDCTCRM